MAYPTVSAPYGLKPVNLVGGRVFAGATRQFPIASGYAANIFNGDVVKLINDGTIEKDTGTATATPVGVFLGCSYTSPALGYQLFSQYYPTGTVASDIVAYVVDESKRKPFQSRDVRVARCALKLANLTSIRLRIVTIFS